VVNFFGGKPPQYVFATVNAEVAIAKKADRDVIDLGMGNPDIETPSQIKEQLWQALQQTGSGRYQSSQGNAELRLALCRWYKRHYGVSLDPNEETVVTLGVKEGLRDFCAAAIQPGESVVVPTPAYPIHHWGPVLAGGVLAPYPVPNSDYVRDIAVACETAKSQVRFILVSWPNNPTTATANPELFSELVAFAKAHQKFVLHDLAYADLHFGRDKAHSFLEVKGAKDVVMEFFSLSKSYSMAGWRVGFSAGNAKLVKALSGIKNFVDYGMMAAIQHAAAWALDNGDQLASDICAKYDVRRWALVGCMNEAGWPVEKPAGTMFIWAPIPKRFAHLGSVKFASKLLKEADIAVAPGAGFVFPELDLGEADQHVRLALIESNRYGDVQDRLTRFLAD